MRKFGIITPYGDRYYIHANGDIVNGYALHGYKSPAAAMRAAQALIAERAREQV